MSEFKFVQKDVIERDFSITSPDDSIIKIEGMQFKYMDTQEWHDLIAEKGDELLFDLVLGWKSFKDGAGNNLKFSKAALEKLMPVAWVKQEIFDTFAKAITGADRKNFSASLALGLQARAAQARKSRPTPRKTRKRNSKR